MTCFLCYILSLDSLTPLVNHSFLFLRCIIFHSKWVNKLKDQISIYIVLTIVIDLFNEEGRRVWNLAACVLTSPQGDSECENRCYYQANWDSLPKTLLLCQLFVFTLSHLAEITPSFCPFKSCVGSKPQVICYLLHRASVEYAVGNPSRSSALEWALFCEPFGSSSCTGLYPLFLAHGR